MRHHTFSTIMSHTQTGIGVLSQHVARVTKSGEFLSDKSYGSSVIRPHSVASQVEAEARRQAAEKARLEKLRKQIEREAADKFSGEYVDDLCNVKAPKMYVERILWEKEEAERKEKERIRQESMKAAAVALKEVYANTLPVAKVLLEKDIQREAVTKDVVRGVVNRYMRVMELREQDRTAVADERARLGREMEGFVGRYGKSGPVPPWVLNEEQEQAWRKIQAEGGAPFGGFDLPRITGLLEQVRDKGGVGDAKTALKQLTAVLGGANLALQTQKMGTRLDLRDVPLGGPGFFPKGQGLSDGLGARAPGGPDVLRPLSSNEIFEGEFLPEYVTKEFLENLLFQAVQTNAKAEDLANKTKDLMGNLSLASGMGKVGG